MLLFAKLAAIGIIIWFYMTADKKAQPPVKWAIIGLVGYLIFWFVGDLIVDNTFAAVMKRPGTGNFILGQIPTVFGVVAAHFIRKKLISNIATGS